MELKGIKSNKRVKKKPLKKPKMESSIKGFHINEVHGVKATHVPPRKEWTIQNRMMGTPYGKFLLKYDDLDNTIDSFNAQDLIFYFREVAKENGYKYMINFRKESGQIKRLMQTYNNREICGMIEFLYTSEQDYLDKNRLSIGLMSSSWVNTIYADFQLWLEDKYIPNNKKFNKEVKHEWKEEYTNNTQVIVGEW